VGFVNLRQLIFSGDALQKMFCDDIGCREVQATVALGEIVEESSDTLFPTYLLLTPSYLLNVSRSQLLKVWCVHDADSSTGYVVNADVLYPEFELGKEVL
jgi:hypothetical protein